MNELFKAELADRISDLIFSSITIGTVMQRDFLQELTSEMKITLDTDISKVGELFIELTKSRDEYQKAVDTMAMEHKVERDMQAALISKLQAEIEELEVERKEMKWYFDRD